MCSISAAGRGNVAAILAAAIDLSAATLRCYRRRCASCRLPEVVLMPVNHPDEGVYDSKVCCHRERDHGNWPWRGPAGWPKRPEGGQADQSDARGESARCPRLGWSK